VAFKTRFVPFPLFYHQSLSELAFPLTRKPSKAVSKGVVGPTARSTENQRNKHEVHDQLSHTESNLVERFECKA